MRRLFGFLAVALIPATLFAQRPSGGSSSSSSTNNSSSSSSSSSSSTYSPPSYSPPASSGGSRSYDGGSRSSDSGSRSSSSSSSSSGGGSYTPPSRSSSDSSSRGSSPSGSSYHPSSTNSSSGYSNSVNTHDSHNGPQIQNRHEFPTNVPAKEPAGAFRGTEQPTSRGSMLPGNNHADANLGHNGQISSTSSRMPYDAGLLNKYRPKEAKIQEQQSRLEEESNRLYTKYKLAGKDAEYERKQAKLDEKRSKLQDKKLKLVKNYQVEAEKRKFKPCTGKNCASAPCPPGSSAGHRGGCIANPPQNSQCGSGFHQDGDHCVQNYQCQSGYSWDGRTCVEAALIGNSVGSCDAYYTRLMQQKRILEDLQRSQISACSGNSLSAECNSTTQQVTVAETLYRQLEAEYTQCLTHR